MAEDEDECVRADCAAGAAVAVGEDDEVDDDVMRNGSVSAVRGRTGGA